MAMACINRADTAVDDVLSRLNAADTTMVDSSLIDTDVELHRSAYASWFSDAGIDDELAASLYQVESDVSANPFAEDAGALLRSLHDGGVRLGIVSDIHFDLRPAFTRHSNPDGSTWADLIDAWVLSFEVGVAKPDPAIFNVALKQLGLEAQDVLMVGDRAGWDGAAVELGIATLLLPELRATTDLRLHRVLDLVFPSPDRFPALRSASRSTR
jgi:FMN phosphatase YigB (HAD superfamily)